MSVKKFEKTNKSQLKDLKKLIIPETDQILRTYEGTIKTQTHIESIDVLENC